MNMDSFPTTKQLVEEARRALAANPMTPRELFDFLVQQGIIDRDGRVLVQRLFGNTDADQDVPVRAPSTNGAPGQPASPPAEQP